MGLFAQIAFFLTLVDFAHGVVVFNLRGYLAINRTMAARGTLKFPKCSI
jgi:hypothetical protein